MQIRITQEGEPVQIISMISPGQVDKPLFLHQDKDGDGVAVYPSFDSDQGPGVYIRTSPRGCSIPADRLEEFTEACLTAVQRAKESG